LLPWDVSVRKAKWEDVKVNWPNLAEIAMKRPNFQPRGRLGDFGVTVKVS